MVMDGRVRDETVDAGGGGRNEAAAVDHPPELDTESPADEADVLEEIVGVIESAAQFGNYRRTQRKDCYSLMRQLKLLLPLIEEIRHHDEPILKAGTAALWSVKKALAIAMKLLKTCNEGSKIYLVGISECKTCIVLNFSSHHLGRNSKQTSSEVSI